MHTSNIRSDSGSSICTIVDVVVAVVVFVKVVVRAVVVVVVITVVVVVEIVVAVVQLAVVLMHTGATSFDGRGGQLCPGCKLSHTELEAE